MSNTKKKTAKQEAKELEIIERGQRVVELRKSGASYRQIATKLKEENFADVNYSTVRRDCKEALKILAADRLEEAEELRELQTQRIESLILAHWSACLGKVEMIKNQNTGVEERKVNAPSVISTWVVLALIRELSETHNLKVKTIEHTGKDGKPIEVVETKVYAGFDPTKV